MAWHSNFQIIFTDFLFHAFVREFGMSLELSRFGQGCRRELTASAPQGAGGRVRKGHGARAWGQFGKSAGKSSCCRGGGEHDEVTRDVLSEGCPCSGDSMQWECWPASRGHTAPDRAQRWRQASRGERKLQGRARPGEGQRREGVRVPLRPSRAGAGLPSWVISRVGVTLQDLHDNGSCVESSCRGQENLRDDCGPCSVLESSI